MNAKTIPDKPKVNTAATNIIIAHNQSPLINAGKKQSRSRTYCLCSVKKMSKKYSDTELDKITSKGIEYLNKKTKSISEKCAKEANAS